MCVHVCDGFKKMTRVTSTAETHFEELLQIDLIYIHHPQTTLKFCIHPRALHDVLQGQQTFLLQIDAIENFVKEPWEKHVHGETRHNKLLETKESWT